MIGTPLAEFEKAYEERLRVLTTTCESQKKRQRAATKGDVIVEVKPGESVSGVAVGWTVERYVKKVVEVEKEEKPAKAKASAKEKKPAPAKKTKAKPAKKKKKK